MNQETVNIIMEQIEFLKADLNREVKLNMDSEFQPEAACKINEAREATKRKILELMEKLAGGETAVDERQRYLQLLERIVSDQSAINMARDALAEINDKDVKERTIENAVTQYETSKREIAEKILARLGRV